MTFFILLLTMALFCCGNENSSCLKYAQEEYLYDTINSISEENFLIYRDALSEKFEERPIKGQLNPTYQLIFYSSHDYGEVIKFEKSNSGYSLKVKCLNKNDWFDECENDQIRITEEEWEQLEEMIYEFNYWTEPRFEMNEVLDGFGYVLEGNRPQAQECNKKTYQLIIRGSPRYDKIGALCSLIREFKNQLVFKYNQEMFRGNSVTQ